MAHARGGVRPSQRLRRVRRRRSWLRHASPLSVAEAPYLRRVRRRRVVAEAPILAVEPSEPSEPPILSVAP